METAEGKPLKEVQFRQKFVETASHEFRTPLTIIQTSCELLQRYADRLDPDNIDLRYSAIYTAIKQITTLLDELLEIERVPANPVLQHEGIDAWIKDKHEGDDAHHDGSDKEELLEMNAQLQQQNLLLQHLHLEKDEMVSIVAHELKNPLAGVMLAASLVEKNWQKMDLHDVVHHLRSIQQNSLRMREMISRLLESSALEMGRFNFSFNFLDVVELVADVANEHREMALQKHITLHFRAFVDSVYIAADRNAVVEILENLVSNAIKFSPTGKSIWIRLIGSKHATETDHTYEGVALFEGIPLPDNTVNFIRVEVQDEGPGIRDDEKSLLFSKFARLSAKPTGGETSTGLGLNIVKKLAEAMSGRVWCESTAGKGATFIVEFPVPDPAVLNEQVALSFLKN